MFKGMILAAGILLIGVALFVGSGVYNVAATVPHLQVTQWVFASVRDQSIETRSNGISPPPLEQEDLIHEGLKSYHSMCIICHSAPGKEPSVIRQGLNPKPPKLEKPRTQPRSDAELYWIIHHGIKMTGMPAFGPTHENDTLWALVAFLRKLPDLSTEEYQAMVAAAGLKEPPGMHIHDRQIGHNGSPAHTHADDHTHPEQTSGDHAH